MDIDSIRSSLSSTLVQVKRHNLSLPLILESKIEAIDLFSWLAGQPEPVQFYWAGRDGIIEIAGVGNAFTLSGNQKSSAAEQAGKINDILTQQQPIFLSARRFDCSRAPSSLWQPFPDDVCYIPARMILRDGDCYRYRICLPVETGTDMEELIAEAQRMNIDPVRQSADIKTDESNRPVASSSEPDSDRWREIVNHVLQAIEAGLVQKTVLARRTDYRFEKKIDPIEFLYSLNRHNRRCYAALYQIEPELAFISVSPERFYRRNENRIELDALSSTAPRGNSRLQDSQFESNLRQSGKERREHQFVIEGVAETIAELGLAEPVIGETTVLKLDQVQHLWTPVTALLQPSITDHNILDRLHPTPAVGGTPRNEALKLIRELESFERGYYAAPIGYISSARAEFAVGIRALVVAGRNVSVFTGAGIVQGSDPEDEWCELNSKDILRSYSTESRPR